MPSRIVIMGFALLFVVQPAGAVDPPIVWTGATPQTSPADPSAGAERTAAVQPVASRGVTRSWPATIGENFSSPIFFDLDGDGRMEIIATDRQRTYVFDSEGSPLSGWPRTGGSDNIPAVADIDEDGTPEIFVASPGAPAKIRCWNPDGTAQAGFPVNLPYQYWLNVTAPAVADVDGDGHLDVGAQTEPGVAFFDRFGLPLPGWPYLWTTTQNIPWSAPAVADIDRDGRMEVVVGNNCISNCAVHVIRHNGTAMPGWPCSTQNIFSAAAVGDLDADGDLEIVIQEGDPTWYGNRMHVWHHDGSYLAGWPRAIAPQWESSRSNPAIADLDDDGHVEIVTMTSDDMLHVLRPDGTELAGYPRSVPGEGNISSVQVVDMDGDRVEEIFFCHYAGTSQWISGWRLDGALLPGFPKLLYSGSELDAHSSAHFADLEGDGDLDLCAQGGTFGSGRVWVYEVDGSLFDPASSRCDWPKIRRDVRNTGAYEPADPAAVADSRLAGAALVCYPNPLRVRDRVAWRVVNGAALGATCGAAPGAGPTAGPAASRIRLFDAAGRQVGGGAIDAGSPRAIPVLELFEECPEPGIYFACPDGRGTAGSSAVRLVIVGP